MCKPHDVEFCHKDVSVVWGGNGTTTVEYFLDEADRDLNGGAASHGGWYRYHRRRLSAANACEESNWEQSYFSNYKIL